MKKKEKLMYYEEVIITTFVNDLRDIVRYDRHSRYIKKNYHQLRTYNLTT